jgi:hypothetical protein
MGYAFPAGSLLLPRGCPCRVRPASALCRSSWFADFFKQSSCKLARFESILYSVGSEGPSVALEIVTHVQLPFPIL